MKSTIAWMIAYIIGAFLVIAYFDYAFGLNAIFRPQAQYANPSQYDVGTYDSGVSLDEAIRFNDSTAPLTLPGGRILNIAPQPEIKPAVIGGDPLDDSDPNTGGHAPSVGQGLPKAPPANIQGNSGRGAKADQVKPGK